MAASATGSSQHAGQHTAEATAAINHFNRLPEDLRSKIVALTGGRGGFRLACKALHTTSNSLHQQPNLLALMCITRWGPEEETVKQSVTAFWLRQIDVLVDLPALLRELKALGARLQPGSPVLADILRAADSCNLLALVDMARDLGADLNTKHGLTTFKDLLYMGSLDVPRRMLACGFKLCAAAEDAAAAQADVLATATRAVSRGACAQAIRFVVEEAGVDARQHATEALSTACLWQSEAAVSELLAVGAAHCGGDVIERREQLQNACMYGSLAACRALLAAGVGELSLDMRRRYCNRARVGGHTDVVQWLQEEWGLAEV
ncbi:hypothetical protein Agub_g6019 [Astrephomene gubernaculifera]|uniref:Ankyrin repeat protein n=1 Tax=Astrephomene gubernaculifera TaxID=47775 RepID=A0AAD3DQM5_9CHLO|nr:hypothetical protein Agub_g6019 [Astrephomene gubernaculifera]